MRLSEQFGATDLGLFRDWLNAVDNLHTFDWRGPTASALYDWRLVWEHGISPAAAVEGYCNFLTSLEP